MEWKYCKQPPIQWDGAIHFESTVPDSYTGRVHKIVDWFALKQRTYESGRPGNSAWSSRLADPYFQDSKLQHCTVKQR